MNDCDYCLKESWSHGGKCKGKTNSSIPCLIFERDPRGQRMYETNTPFKVKFGMDIPRLHEPNTDYFLSGIEKTITFTKFCKIEWDRDARGLHGIKIWADFWYWSDENGQLPPRKPKLRLIKN